MIIKCNENCMDMEFDFLYESMTSFNDIFEEIGLNESSLTVITEASVHEIIEKIKAFFKKLFQSFIDTISNAFDIYKQRVFLFNRFYEANSLSIFAICKAILNRKIPKEKLEKESFDTYAFFSFDEGIHMERLMGDRGFKLDEYNKRNIFNYTKGDLSDSELDSILKGEQQKSAKDTLRFIVPERAIREVIDMTKGDDDDIIAHIKSKKAAFMDNMAKPHMPITAENIGKISNNISEIYQNMGKFNSEYKKAQRNAKIAYETIIKTLSDLEDHVIKGIGEKGMRITTAVNKYSNHYKKILDDTYYIMSLGLQLRANQIKSYFKIMRYLMRFVAYIPTGAISPNKYKEEDVKESVAMFENVVFDEFTLLDSSINEASGFEMIRYSSDKPTKDYKAAAVAIVNSAEEYCKKNFKRKKITQADGSLGGEFKSSYSQMATELVRLITGWTKKIEDKKPTSHYSFVIPSKLYFSIFGMNVSKNASKEAEEILTGAGFKKGQEVKTMPGVYYYYKMGSNKKHMYLAYNSAAKKITIDPANTSISINLYFIDNTEDNRAKFC